MIHRAVAARTQPEDERSHEGESGEEKPREHRDAQPRRPDETRHGVVLPPAFTTGTQTWPIVTDSSQKLSRKPCIACGAWL